MNTLVEIKNLSVGYNNNIVLEDVNLTIKSNDFIGVIGPNGGGKTTLLKVILGLLKPFKGEVVFKNALAQNNKLIGYLPQINSIDKKFPISVEQVIESGLLHLKRRERLKINQKEIVTNTLNDLKLTTIAKKSIGELSGGQMQRVFLGRAIISQPQLLILDEPDTFVDNTFESELYLKLKELNNSMAILLVSHDLGTISSYVKNIACVNRSLHLHKDNKITQEQLDNYNCPIKIIAHGEVPHTILHHH